MRLGFPISALLVSLPLSLLAVGDNECERIVKAGGKVSAGKASVGTTQWAVYKCSHCGGIASMKPDQKGDVRCGGCGNPHDKEPYFYEDTITSDNLADTAQSKKFSKSGKKWTCAHCDTSNFSTSSNCESCGSARETGSTLTPRIVTAPQHIDRDPFAAHARRSESTSYERQVSESPRRPAVWPWALGGLGATGVGALIWALTATNTYQGTVTDMPWQHTTTVHRFTPTTKRDWRDNLSASSPVMPINGSGERAGVMNIRNCSEEYYQTIQVPDGTETYYESVPYDVPYQDSEWQDNGNGSREMVSVTRYRTEYRQEERTRTKYRPQPIYKTKCDYDTYEWKLINSASASGNDPERDSVGGSLPWKSLSLGNLDRESRSSLYKVILTYDVNGKTITHEITPKTQSEFLDWKMGEKITVNTNKFGGVKSLVRSNGNRID